MADTKMQLVDWLDDLCVRFIINLPQEELESVERICFQVEEAQWFYEDFVRPLDPTLPSLNLRQFCLLMFQHCPLLAPFPEHQHLAAFDEFLAYKVRVPVRGAIMLDQNMEEVVLVKGWKKSANWSFPRGKINKDEDDLDCAIREVYEETGFDIGAAGLVHDRQKQKHIDVTMREQHMKLFVFRGVPKDTIFLPRTRKEISKIQWYKLAELPGYHKNKQNKHANSEETVSSSKLYMVAPFMGPLKKWIAKQRNAEATHIPDLMQDSAAEEPLTDHAATPDNAELRNRMEHSMATEHNLRRLLAHDQLLQPLTAHAQMSKEDATAQLKQFLSIGKQLPTSPATLADASANVNANNILAILRQGPKNDSLGLPTQASGLPQTPMEQISYDFPEPKTPRHHQPPPPLMANVPPPPRFPLVPTQTTALQSYNQQFLSSNGANDGAYFNNGQAGLHAPQSRATQTSHSTFAAHNPTMVDRSRPHPQLYNPPAEYAPPPYKRTGDPQFGVPQRASELQGPSIPPASQLPVPSLSQHAQSLLDVFKSKERTGLPPISRGPHLGFLPVNDQTPSNTNSKAVGHQLQSVSANTIPAHDESRSRQVLGQAPGDSSIPNVFPMSQKNAPTVSPVVSKPSIQREALLSLFRPPSVATPPTEAPRAKSGDLLQAAFELSAIPSPRPQGRELPHAQRHASSPGIVSRDIYDNDAQEHRVELSAMPSPKLVPQLLRRQKAPKIEDSTFISPAPIAMSKEIAPPLLDSSPPRTSATLQAPQNVPDFGTVKRKHRAPKSPSMSAANVFDVPVEADSGTVRHAPRTTKTAYGRLDKQNQHPQRPAPIQILKRPAQEVVSSPDIEAHSERPVLAAAHRKQSPLIGASLSPARLNTRSPKPPTPKPFQPQILRRPQSSSFDSPALEIAAKTPEGLRTSSAVPSPAATPNPTTDADRRQALLSLFSQPKALSDTNEVPVKVENTGPVHQASTVPLANLPFASAPSPAPTTPSTDHAKNLLSLFATKPPPAPSPLTSMLPPSSTTPLTAKITTARSPAPPEVSRSRINSVASAGGSGTQTPISPSDRGFLMSYLRGL